MAKAFKKTLCTLLVGLIAHAVVLSSMAMVWCPSSGTVHSDYASLTASGQNPVTADATQLAKSVQVAASVKQVPVCGAHHKTISDALTALAPDEHTVAVPCVSWPSDGVVVSSVPAPPPDLSASAFLRELKTVVLVI